MFQGKYEEADVLNTRAIEIQEKALGPDHPSLATSLTTRSWLLKTKGKYEEADVLNRRAIEIQEKALGPDHPSLATSLELRAWLLNSQ
ncbi:unnamed protein product, partial [Ectocarpus sp. 8 AP-2014]